MKEKSLSLRRTRNAASFIIFCTARGGGMRGKMNNNDILVRLRYALDIKEIDMVEIFKLGGINLTKDEVLNILKKSEYEFEEDSEYKICDNFMLESFLNGFIIFKRGEQRTEDGQVIKQPLVIKNNKQVNNVVLKKLKIALSLSSEDMLNILEEAGVIISKGELSAVFRRESHKNYKECGERYVRNFFKGLAIKYRDDK